MPDVHSRYPASGSHRWIPCPGSIRISEKCKADDTGSDYAKEGTLAHSIAELKLRIATDRTVKADELKTLTKSEYWDGEMDEATDFYRDLVMEHLNAAGDGAELMIEQRVDYSDWVPGGFGTSDAVIIADDTIEIIDLKYGKGIRVDAKDNSQMRLYALGAFQIFGDLYDFDKVKTTICQPRLDHVSSEELTVTELLDWATNVVEPAAKEAESDNPHTAAGDWCRWCPARAVCRTRAEANLELAKYDFQPGELLDPEEIAEILGKVDELTKWAADIQDYALKQALAGEHYDGWKLVEGRSVRKYTDELKVAEALQKEGFDEAVLYERKLLGITAMEKLVGKKKLAEALKGLIEKPAGKPVLVPQSDKREAINSAAQAAADFTD
jgi:hypothetical protein